MSARVGLQVPAPRRKNFLPPHPIPPCGGRISSHPTTFGTYVLISVLGEVHGDCAYSGYSSMAYDGREVEIYYILSLDAVISLAEA